MSDAKRWKVSGYDFSFSDENDGWVDADEWPDHTVVFVPASDYDALRVENDRLRGLLRRCWDGEDSQLPPLRDEIDAALAPTDQPGVVRK